MNTIATFRKCTLSNEELIQAVDSATDQMYSEPFKVPFRHVPARPNEDYDLIVGELILRFAELEKAAKSVLDGWHHPDLNGEMWIPDFCGDPIENLGRIIKYDPNSRT